MEYLAIKKQRYRGGVKRIKQKILNKGLEDKKGPSIYSIPTQRWLVLVSEHASKMTHKQLTEAPTCNYQNAILCLPSVMYNELMHLS